MKRVKWFNADWPLSLRTIATRMRASSFTPESNDGFFVERSRDNMIEGRYIEKMSYQEVLDDPFGNKLTFDRLVYRQVMFVLFNDFPRFEMRDAPRSAARHRRVPGIRDTRHGLGGGAGANPLDRQDRLPVRRDDPHRRGPYA